MIHNLKKKTRQDIIKGLVAIVLAAIIINQMLWFLSMHNLHQQEFENCIDQSARQAVWMELSDRQEKIGGHRYINFGTSHQNDTSRFIVKNVVTADSTYTVTIDRHDIHSANKVTQLVLKDFLPIDLHKLNSIFISMVSKDYMIQDSYFEYIDLESGNLLQSNQTSSNTVKKYHKTEIIPLDINNSIGVVGFAQTPTDELLARMLKQLILSIVLIIIAMGGMFYISKSFITQWKVEKMRQESVNAMTHEFKRPISAAMLLASLIPYYIKRNDTGTVLEYSENINNELTKLNLYINTIIQISNSENSEIKLNKTEVDIDVLLKSIKSIYSNVTDSDKIIKINLEVKAKNRIMYVDVVHLSNVFDNLIENAIKYNTNNPIIIELSVNDFNNRHIISVKDNGIGISSKSMTLIFRRYYRIKQSCVENVSGIGLGLTYSKSIIEAHAGSISVNSVLNKGSTFDIII